MRRGTLTARNLLKGHRNRPMDAESKYGSGFVEKVSRHSRSALRLRRTPTEFDREYRGLGELIMRAKIVSLLFLTPLAWACGGSFPPPSQRLADAQSAERSARELGANDEPEAQLSLRLAQEKIAKAQKAMTKGENEQADGLLMRAKADAVSPTTPR
jgi:hypothetical protein